MGLCVGAKSTDLIVGVGQYFSSSTGRCVFMSNTLESDKKFPTYILLYLVLRAETALAGIELYLAFSVCVRPIHML